MPKTKRITFTCVQCNRQVEFELDEDFEQWQALTFWAMSMDSTCRKCWEKRGYRLVTIGDNFLDYFEEPREEEQ